MRAIDRAVLVSGLLLAALAAPASAQRADDDERAPPTIGETAGRVLNEAIELLNAEDYARAREVLGDLRLDRLSPYERSRVERIFANIDYEEERYDSAREHLSRALASGGLSESEALQVRFQIAQLFITEERWAEAAAALEEWFAATANPNSAAYYMLAAAYYQLGDLDRAFPPAKQAVELTDEPLVAWIQLLVALYIEREQYEPALPYVLQLVAIEPDRKVHWQRLSSFYQQLEQYDRALAALQVPYNAGMLDEGSEQIQLADLLMFNQIPHRGARVIEAGLQAGTIEADADIYEKLANCWIAAREFDQAISPLERAAELADDGELYLRLAEVQVQREDWTAAAEALDLGIEKGGLEDEGAAEILMGIALYNDGRSQDAIGWFERAQDSDEHRDLATQYIRLIESQAESA